MSFSCNEDGQGVWWRTTAILDWSGKDNGGMPGCLGMASRCPTVALHEPRSRPGAHPGRLLLVDQEQDAQLHNGCLTLHSRHSHSAT